MYNIVPSCVPRHKVHYCQVNAMEICALMGFECKEGQISAEQINEAANKTFLVCSLATWPARSH